MCFSGGSGVWHPLLDVLHSPWSHREVTVSLSSYKCSRGLYLVQKNNLVFLFFASQEVQQEPSGSALVLC